MEERKKEREKMQPELIVCMCFINGHHQHRIVLVQSTKIYITTEWENGVEEEIQGQIVHELDEK